jgi:hypothetical protein
LYQFPVSLDRFLSPCEDNTELLRLYAQAMISKAVNPHWCPIPYLIAVHHLNSFLYLQQQGDGEQQKMRGAILKQLVLQKDQVIFFSWVESTMHLIPFFSGICSTSVILQESKRCIQVRNGAV